MARQRSPVYTAKVVVETDTRNDEEHKKRVTWALENFSKSNQYMADTYCSIVIFDEEGNVVLTNSSGALRLPPEEQLEIFDLLMEE